jgi:short-subunit dehydrogenase
MSTNKGFALITGASTGIGAIYADRLAKRGHDLILVARNAEKLHALATKIRRDHARTVEVVSADLGKRTDLARVEKVLREDPRITTLVNNAGVVGPTSIFEAKADQMSEMIALNVDALTRLTLAAIPGFVARHEGTIINIASIVAVAPELLNGVYGGTKAFVLAFSQNLRAQLADKGVRVQVVMPGATATDFWDLTGTPHTKLPAEIVMPASEMVDASLTGLDQGEFATIPSLPAAADWETFEAARQALRPNLSRKAPADRYGIRKTG